MKQFLRNIRIVIVFFLVIMIMFASGLVLQQKRSVKFIKGVSGENKDALKRRYSNAGSILSYDGTPLAKTVNGVRNYAEDDELARASLQIVGDYTHNISNTIESTEESALCGIDRNPLDSLLLLLQNKQAIGDTLTVTLRDSVQKESLRQLKSYNGSIVALNYKTGAIAAMVSTPTTSPQNITQWNEVPEGAAFNRAILGEYLPGSTFKMITSAAWINNNSYDSKLIVQSEGSKPLRYPGGVTDRKAFGDVGLDRAFAVSSNAFFGSVAEKVGSDQIIKWAGIFGYGKSVELNRMSVTQSRIEIPPNDAVVMQWLGIGQPIGQSVLVTTPLQLSLQAATIANGGDTIVPQIIAKRTTPLGREVYSLRPQKYSQVVPKQTATQISQLMKLCVTDGTGAGADIDGLDIRGKTGTVEIKGKDTSVENSLFVGFIADSNSPYAIAVVMENASSGAAATAARSVLQALSKLK